MKYNIIIYAQEGKMVVFLQKTKLMKEYVITVVETNNPAILKFETNHFLTNGSNFEFKNID
jgi:hypothetical protein